MAELPDAAKKSLGQYEHVWKYFKGINSQTTRNPRTLDSEPSFLEDLKGQPARPRGLTLTSEIDLSKESTTDGLKILRWAIERNCPELIKDLWTATRKLIEEINDQLRTPIFSAIETRCDPDTFQALLEWPSVRPDLHDRGGKTLLLFAAEIGLYKAVEFLLKRGADIKAKDKEARTAFSLASENGHYNTVERLLGAGAEVNAQDGRYGNALAAAA